MTMSAAKIVTLKAYAVAIDGLAVRLNLVDDLGNEYPLEFSVNCLKDMVLETPKMMAEALATLYGNPCQRLVHNVERCTVERSMQAGTLILNFTTGDGFALSFALPQQELLDIASGVTNDNFDEYRELYGVH